MFLGLSNVLVEASSAVTANVLSLNSFFDSVARDDDVLKLISSVQNGVANNASKCQSYLRNWDSYREIWEINKDAFIRRYAKLKPAMSTFEADINRYTEGMNLYNVSLDIKITFFDSGK